MFNNIKIEMECYIVYALQLKQGKYYVGKVHRLVGLDICYDKHLKGIACEFTKMYKPIHIIESIESSYGHYSAYDDVKLMKKYMMTFGIEHVRGDALPDIILDEFTINTLINEFKYIKNEKNIYYKKDETESKENMNTILSKLLSNLTKQQIENEIEWVENTLITANRLRKLINVYKYVDCNLCESIEIDPSIIDSYNMRNLIWPYKIIEKENLLAVKIYEYILKICKENYLVVEIKDESLVVQNIYKFYIHRKKLEKELLEILQYESLDANKETINYDDNNIYNLKNKNIDELFEYMNAKNELLYKKLCDFI